jgi:hypothetical protein
MLTRRAGRLSILKLHVAELFMMDESIDWREIIKKEARGIDDYDLGKVQKFDDQFVVTEKGLFDKDKFYVPREKAFMFDGDKLWFEITKHDATTYKHD